MGWDACNGDDWGYVVINQDVEADWIDAAGQERCWNGEQLKSQIYRLWVYIGQDTKISKDVHQLERRLYTCWKKSLLDRLSLLNMLISCNIQYSGARDNANVRCPDIGIGSYWYEW